jgi:hypothetical protein
MKVYEILLLIALAAFLVWIETSPVRGACLMSYCKDMAVTPTKKRTYITNTSRQRVGDVYDPGTGRIQIRNNHRQIKFYIERS